MIKKTVTYKDFDNNELTDDLYFHLSEADLIDWIAEDGEGMIDNLLEIAKTEDIIEMIPLVKALVLKSYGVKSPDGRSFIKSDEVKKNFEYSAAFAGVYKELVTNPDKFLEFVDGVVPVEYKSNNDSENLSRVIDRFADGKLSDEEKKELIDKMSK